MKCTTAHSHFTQVEKSLERTANPGVVPGSPGADPKSERKQGTIQEREESIITLVAA